MNYRLLPILFCVVSSATSVALFAQANPRSERVFLQELEGMWVNEAYGRALAKSRMPHAVARRTPPVVIAIKREGRSYPIVITNFDKVSVLAVLDVEPDNKPGSYRLVLGPDDRPVSSSAVKYLWFRGARNAQGKFDKLSMAETFFMKGRMADFVNVGTELGPFVNRAVISGRYTDERGAAWEFSDAGEARWPDQTFHFELSLNDRRADCEYLEAEDLDAPDGKKRYGYAWKANKLQIFPAKMVSKRVHCSARPLATLSPQ